MREDVRATVEEWRGKGVEFTKEISDEGFGLMTAIRLPSGREFSIDEADHPSLLSSSHR